MTLHTRKDKVSTKRIYEGNIFTVRLDSLACKSGSKTTREVVETSGGVVIACKPEKDRVMLIRQYRYVIDQELIELPAGRVNKDEDRLSAAKRELVEETGYQALNWQELMCMYPTPGFCDELLTCYLAQDIKWVGKNLDEDEETDVLILPINEAWQMIVDGKIRDAKTIAVLGLVRTLL